MSGMQSEPDFVPLSIVSLDDDADFGIYIRALLDEEGHEIRVASTQRECLQLCVEQLPDILLLDIKMGRESGEEVLATIRERWPGLCVIVVTGYPSMETMRTTFKRDVFDYLAKPFSLDELRGVLRQAAEVFDLGRRPQDRLRVGLGKRIRLSRTTKIEHFGSLSQHPPKLIERERRGVRGSPACGSGGHGHVQGCCGEQRMSGMQSEPDFVPLSIVSLDDDADFGIYIRALLDEEGHEIRVASTQRECLQLCVEQLPDILLLDIKMGRESGEEVLATIRERWPGLCVIVVTGYPSMETMRTTFKRDVFDYLAKPFSLDELRGVLRQAAEVFDLGRRPQDRLRVGLGKRIRLSRTTKDMTLRELGDVCGVSVSQLSSIERGAHMPSVESLLAIAHALHAKPSEWLKESGF